MSPASCWLDSEAASVLFQERQQAQIGNMVEFAIALMGKLDGINRHSFNSFRLRVGECMNLQEMELVSQLDVKK